MCVLSGPVLVTFLAVALAVCATADAQEPPRNPENVTEIRAGLRELYDGWGGKRWTFYNASGVWFGENDNYCDWEYLSCTSDVSGEDPTPESAILTYFNLPAIGISGTFPLAPLMKFPNIRIVVLSGNNLHGPIPEGISALQTVTDVFADNNKFGGTLPSSLSTLPFLTGFWVHFNNLTGPMVPGIFPTQIQSISVFGNSFYGELTEEFLSSIPNCNVLLMEKNKFHGQLPHNTVSWGQQLQLFILSDNQFHGSLPASWANLKQLTELQISDNHLSGELPNGLFQSLQQLMRLNLAENSFNGSLPDAIGYLPELILLDLAGNDFSGSIPDSWTHLTGLHDFSVGNNFLSGPLPRTLKASQAIDLSGNNFQATSEQLVQFIGQSGASIISVAGNTGIHGTLPRLLTGVITTLDEFYGINNIFALTIANCSFYGALPNFLGMFQSLTILDISNNNFTGPLPLEWIKTSSKVASLNVYGNDGLHNDDSPLFKLSEFSRMQFGLYICPAVDLVNSVPLTSRSPSRVELFGLSPAYFDFKGCTCLSGYSGKPPHCKRDSDTLALAISLPLVAIAIASLTSLLLYYRRKRVKRARERTADRILSAYAAHQAKQGGAGPSSTLNPLAVASALQKAELSVSNGSRAATNGTSTTASDATGGSALSRLFSADSDWIIPFSKISILRQLATGASASVSLGIWNDTRVAVKQYHLGMNIDMTDFSAELAVHVKLRHPNVVQLLGISLDPLAVVLEFMDRGSLFHILQADPDSIRFPGRSHTLAMHIARGMAFLHSKSVLHRDLKSLNILVDGNWNAKISDFGTSRVQASSSMTIGLGTVRWMAPETMGSAHYDMSCDVYSFALVMWEVLTGGKLPYEECRFDFEVIEFAQEGGRPSIPPSCPEPYLALITECWCAEPSKRPTFTRVLERLGSMTVDMFGQPLQ